MANNNINNYNSTGISFGGLLTIVFIVLKLTKYIDWSWLWVLSPLWLPIAFILVIGFILFIINLLLD